MGHSRKVGDLFGWLWSQPHGSRFTMPRGGRLDGLPAMVRESAS